MNLAELGAVMTVLTSTIAGTAAALDQKAGWATVFFAVVGFVVGLVSALVVLKLAYRALSRTIPPPGRSGTVGSIASLAFYCLSPILSITAAATTTVLLTTGVLRLSNDSNP
ncbi:MAG: hypothetical protein JWR15_3179 [Prosthecobacter sp.]|nr:hypothetical protein [Prosthecobacter sp.]